MTATAMRIRLRTTGIRRDWVAHIVARGADRFLRNWIHCGELGVSVKKRVAPITAQVGAGLTGRKSRSLASRAYRGNRSGTDSIEMSANESFVPPGVELGWGYQSRASGFRRQGGRVLPLQGLDPMMASPQGVAPGCRILPRWG